MAVLALLLITICLPSMIQSSTLLDREDCTLLYSMVRGKMIPLEANDEIQRIYQKIQDIGIDGIVRLYDYCLRSEEGIRFKRTKIVEPISQKTTKNMDYPHQYHHHHHLNRLQAAAGFFLDKNHQNQNNYRNSNSLITSSSSPPPPQPISNEETFM